MNAETTINSQNKSQAKSTSAFVNSRKRTYKLRSVCRTLRELLMSYNQKLFPLKPWTLEGQPKDSFIFFRCNWEPPTLQQWSATFFLYKRQKALGLRTVVPLWSPLNYFYFNLQLTRKTSTKTPIRVQVPTHIQTTNNSDYQSEQHLVGKPTFSNFQLGGEISLCSS